MKMKIQWTWRSSKIRRMAGNASFARSSVCFVTLWAAVFMTPLLTAQDNPPPRARFSTNRILVKPNPGADLTGLHAALGTTVVRSFSRIGNLQVVRLPQNASVTNMLAQFQQSGLVQYADPDYMVRALATPNDPKYQDGSLWGLNKINSPQAW